MRTHNIAIVVAGLLVAFMVAAAAGVYLVDSLVQAPRDRALCSLMGSQAAVVNALADDLASAGQPISDQLDRALDDLAEARELCS